MSSADDLRHEFLLGLVEEAAKNPVHRLEILNLIGDVHEGYARFFAGGAWSAHDEPLMNGEPVYVVRPRGEAS